MVMIHHPPKLKLEKINSLKVQNLGGEGKTYDSKDIPEISPHKTNKLKFSQTPILPP